MISRFAATEHPSWLVSTTLLPQGQRACCCCTLPTFLQPLHGYKNKPRQILCGACADQFNSRHVFKIERVIDTHGSMEIEKRAIWFDIRLIMCQRGDRILSIRAFALECHPNKAHTATGVWVSNLRSAVAQLQTSPLEPWSSLTSGCWSASFLPVAATRVDLNEFKRDQYAR